jgi:hypothetical protein
LTGPLTAGGVIGDVLDSLTPSIKMIVVYKSKMQVKKVLEFMPSDITLPLGSQMHTFFIL